MEKKPGSWWLNIKRHPVATGGVVLLALILFTFSAYRFGWAWTGFSSGINQITITNTSKENFAATISQPSKSLWDWFQLLAVLAIPIVVGLGAAWYTAQQGRVSDRENKDNQRETALQAYIDKMSELLLEKNLRESGPDDEVRKIARVRTLTVLRGLDPVRKGSLLRFLYESSLIRWDINNSIVDLKDADLSSANLTYANLSDAFLQGNIALSKTWMSRDDARINLQKAKLSGVILKGAILRGARLCEADLSGAYLSRVDLIGTHLHKANLQGAKLRATLLQSADITEADLGEANLHLADLTGADLSGANLKGATGITVEKLEQQVKSLKGATMPDGSIHR